MECSGTFDHNAGNLTMSGGTLDLNGDYESAANSNSTISDGNITIAAISQALNYIQTDLLRDLPNRWKLKNGQSSVEETLYNPYFLNNSSVNPKLREKYGFTSLHDWDPNNFEKMKKYLERLDQVHNTDFITECPEFEGYNNV